MKVVLDVNVWISGLLWSGSPSKILRLAQTKTIVIYTSELLLQELNDTLNRDKLQRRIQRIWSICKSFNGCSSTVIYFYSDLLSGSA